MATIEYIKKRIAGKEKEIEKLEKKLERINSAKATGWEKNPYYYEEHDLKCATRDLEAAITALNKLKADLAMETEKAASRDVKAILDFLERWKERMRKFYADMYPKYLEAYEMFCEENSETLEWWRLDGEARKEMYEANRRLKEEFYERWHFMEQYVDHKGFDNERFEKDIKVEAERKYDNIIERTNAICGRITDATGLTIGDAGELDGYIIGEKGTAHVHTIGAGGYNIQCFHFRVLVHKVNK